MENRCFSEGWNAWPYHCLEKGRAMTWSVPVLAEGGTPERVQEVDGNLLLQRGINRLTLSLLGSANLVHPGLRPNGPSDIASRHRLRRPQQQGHASPASRSEVTIHLHIVSESVDARTMEPIQAMP